MTAAARRFCSRTWREFGIEVLNSKAFSQVIDPLLSLAFSMHSQKGVYALLLGSGISSSAGIPTGWDILKGLASRLAAIQGEDPKPDPEAWYKQKYGEELDYSRLIGELASTPSERQQLLRGYFEPSEEDVQQNVKIPTAAHHAIASLVKAGLVRVILTTNFDRLMERAIEQAGVTPTVISSPDAVLGALPLQHSGIGQLHRCHILLPFTRKKQQSYAKARQRLIARLQNRSILQHRAPSDPQRFIRS
jgi:hypothetical protein